MTSRTFPLLPALALLLVACPGPSIVDTDPCAADPGDDDGDGVCEVLDQCEGDDAAGDSDGDGRCDDIDQCEGDDTTEDSDGDGICDDIDPCFGDNATSDSDEDGICDDQDACEGEDASGDRDQDGLCDDTDPCVQLHAEFHPDWCEVVFVDAAASGAQDGTSWADAYRSVDAAVSEAVRRGGPDRPYEVWLAEGTYRPSAAGEPVLVMPEGLVVRGGFTDRAVREGDRSGGPSILSGDRLGNDVPLDLDTVEAERDAPNQASRADNSPTVVTMASSTELDRVAVHDGYATDVRLGIGVHIAPASEGVIIRDSAFSANIGAVRNANGGALGIGSRARVEVVASTFEANIAWNGAGIMVAGAEYVVIEHDAFEDNAAMSQGAGVYLADTEGQVDHSRFLRNRIVENNGVALLATRSRGSVTDTLFEANVGPNAVQIDPDHPFELLNLTFVDHTDDGGVLRSGEETIVGNCVFWNNARDLHPDPRLQPRELHHSCSDTDHRAWEDTNVHLDGRSARFGNPFSPGATRRYLAHEAAGDPFTSACVDLGHTEDADRAFPLWREFTTRKDGVKDGSTGDPVDAGAHYEVR